MSATEQVMMQAQNLTKSYKGKPAVDNANLKIIKGDVIALIGTNGAGKSTTLSMLLGIIKPDQGTVYRWCKDYKSKLGVQLQSTPFFEGYTTAENMELFTTLYNISLSKADIENHLKKCGLSDVKRVSASKLSIGQQKRLAIAVTTIHNPELIILDEPTAGLDPRARRDIRQMIQRLTQEGVTVVFSSHDMEEVYSMATKIIIMHNGKILTQGIPDNLLSEHAVDNLETLYLDLTGEYEKYKKYEKNEEGETKHV